MKYVLIIIVYFLVLSCKSTKYSKQENSCNFLVELYNNDQLYRNMPELIDPFFKILDSIKSAEGISNDEYTDLSREEQLAYGKKARSIVKKISSIAQKKKDSLMDLQVKLDNRNTRQLLSFVKKKGYPNMKELGCNGYSAPVLIFVHSPEKYWKEVKNMINEEKKEKRISKGDYQYIMWHINGRKGVPFKSSKKVEIISVN